jgi:hypothetical protein
VLHYARYSWLLVLSCLLALALGIAGRGTAESWFALDSLSNADARVALQSAVDPRSVSEQLGGQARPAGEFLIFFPVVLSPGGPTIRKGVGLTYENCADALAVGATWQYRWVPLVINCPGLENVPMIWGASDVAKTVTGNSQWIMGFNEPDLATQANISPAKAATLWRTIEGKYPGRSLLAPAPSAAHPDWLVQFRNAYIGLYKTAPRLDGLAVHCYRWTAEDCISLTQWYLARAKEWGISEVWVSEFAFLPCGNRSIAQAEAEMEQYIQWMKGNPKITRYAWFASRIRGDEWWAFQPRECNTPLLDFDRGSLTAFGNGYLKMP